MTDTDDPEIYYIDAAPGEANYYNPVTNTIILDEKLKDYPQAHHRVLVHEFGHHIIRGNLLQTLWHELRNDLELAFSTDTAIEQYRSYENDVQSVDRADRWIMLTGYLTNMLRSLWTMILYPTGRAYRWLKHTASQPTETSQGGGG